MSLADAGQELKYVLGAHFVHFGCAVAFEELTSRPWASVTFAGERHRLTFSRRGPGAAAAADQFLAGLADREFPLRGHIVADIAAVGDVRDDREGRVRLTLEALTVESG